MFLNIISNRSNDKWDPNSYKNEWLILYSPRVSQLES